MRIEPVLVICLLAGGAFAADLSAKDKARAKTEYQKAQKAYDLGNFKDALAGFSEAYRIDPRPAFLFNIGQCHRMLGEHERAVFFFDRFLSFYPPGKAPNDKLVHDLLAEEEEKLKVTSAPPPPLPENVKPLPAPPAAETPPLKPALEPAPYPGVAPPPPPLVPKEEAPGVAQTGGLTSKWWFWTAVGVVAVGVITTGALVAAKPQPRMTSLPDGDFR